jgi:uncharacterized protein YuzB (UPF0349 family)
MHVKVRFCENNKGKSQVYRRLQEEFPALDTKIKKCLGQCGNCAEQPIALVGGKKFKGKDLEDLYRNIVAALREGAGTEEKKDKEKKKEKKNR